MLTTEESFHACEIGTHSRSTDQVVCKFPPTLFLDFLTFADQYRLAEFIPMSPHGSVLITTRDKSTGMKLAGVGHVMEIERMNPDAAKTLALKKINLTSQADDRSMKMLVEDCMECLPLAIVQAGAFIGCTGMTVASYIQLYQASECNAMELLSEEFEDLGRDLSRPSAVTRTFAISFDQIKRQDLRAAELLFLIAHLNRQGIPKSLLRSDHEPELSLEKSIGTLKAFALVTESPDDGDLNMHRLVHLAVRKFLRDTGKVDEWAIATLRKVSRLYPDGGVSTWKTCAKYLSHAQAALSSHVNDNGSNLDRAQLLHKTGVYLEEQGRYGTAAKMVQEASGFREHILGKDDPLTLQSKHKYGWVLLRQGRYDEAEEICRQELEGRHSTVGNDHSETLQSMNLLADVLRRQCKYIEAEKLYRKILPLTMQVNGNDHHFTLACKFNFAVVLEIQGSFKEAEKWIRNVVTEREKIFGKEHPTVFDSISRVGCILNRQGRYAEAERLHRDLLSARKQALGEQHPDVLISMRNLGISLRGQGNQEEAQTLFRHVLEERQKALGEYHPYTLGISYNLAYSLFLQGRHSFAADILTQVCAQQELTLGFLHQDTLSSIHLLAKVLEGEGQGSRAEELYRRVIVGSEKVFGKEHLDTVKALCDLAFLVSRQHEFQPAQDLAERLSKRGDALGESTEIQQNVVNLAKALDQKGQFQIADLLYRLGIAAIAQSSGQGEYGAQSVKEDHDNMLQKIERTSLAPQPLPQRPKV
jgi:tetratricopeptide (TPR) repeat protein